jgi:hypothetical protein
MKVRRKSIAYLSVAPAAMAMALCMLPGGASAQSSKPASPPSTDPRPATPADVNLTRTDVDYADPSVPNVSGFWRPDPKVPLERFFLLNGTQLPLRDEYGQDGFPYKPDWQRLIRRDATRSARGSLTGIRKRPAGRPASTKIMSDTRRRWKSRRLPGGS